MSPDKYDKSTDLENTFKIFDENGDHFITAEELKNVMKKLGQTLTDDEINLMITEADTDGDKQVNYKGKHQKQTKTTTKTHSSFNYFLISI